MLDWLLIGGGCGLVGAALWVLLGKKTLNPQPAPQPDKQPQQTPEILDVEVVDDDDLEHITESEAVSRASEIPAGSADEWQEHPAARPTFVAEKGQLRDLLTWAGSIRGRRRRSLAESDSRLSYQAKDPFLRNEWEFAPDAPVTHVLGGVVAGFEFVIADISQQSIVALRRPFASDTLVYLTALDAPDQEPISGAVLSSPGVYSTDPQAALPFYGHHYEGTPAFPGPVWVADDWVYTLSDKPADMAECAATLTTLLLVVRQALALPPKAPRALNQLDGDPTRLQPTPRPLPEDPADTPPPAPETPRVPTPTRAIAFQAGEPDLHSIATDEVAEIATSTRLGDAAEFRGTRIIRTDDQPPSIFPPDPGTSDD